MTWIKVTRTRPSANGKVLERSYTHTTSCCLSSSLMNLQMQGLITLGKLCPFPSNHIISFLLGNTSKKGLTNPHNLMLKLFNLCKSTPGRTLQRCLVFPGGEPPPWSTSSGSPWLMASRRSCYLGSLTRSTTPQLDMALHMCSKSLILWRPCECEWWAFEKFVWPMEFLCFQVEKREDGIAGEREENPVMEAVSERERESEEKEARWKSDVDIKEG